MSPLSGWVLGAATVVASPALWSTFVDNTMPLEVGLMRLLIAVGISWLLLSLVAAMAFPDPNEARARQPDPAAPDVESSEKP